MINKILDGITNALYQEFGKCFHIYTENMEQGVQEPCFFVSCVSPTDERWLGNRRKLTNKFSIQYLPYTDEPKRECNAVRDRLTVALEYIRIPEGDLIEGTKFSSEMTNGFLTTFVNYDCFANRIVDQDPYMEEMTMKGGLKNGKNRKESKKGIRA